jgi:hypothetical protein
MPPKAKAEVRLFAAFSLRGMRRASAACAHARAPPHAPHAPPHGSQQQHAACCGTAAPCSQAAAVATLASGAPVGQRGLTLSRRAPQKVETPEQTAARLEEARIQARAACGVSRRAPASLRLRARQRLAHPSTRSRAFPPPPPLQKAKDEELDRVRLRAAAEQEAQCVCRRLRCVARPRMLIACSARALSDSPS